jgi:biopolymer transport protein ExbD
MGLRRRGRRGGGPERADPNLIPLLDVVLQLITFFMMLVHFGTRIEGATRAVRLPTAPAALPGTDLGLDRIVTAIDETGRLHVEGRVYDDAASPAPWTELATRRREGMQVVGAGARELPTVVVVRADRAATYGMVRGALAAAESAGFAHFTLVVLREREPSR